jgi:hypothetical protein
MGSSLIQKLKAYAPGGLFGGLAGIALLSGRLHSVTEIVVAGFAFGTSVSLTVRWYLRQRMRQEADAAAARQTQLAAFHKDVERVSSESKDTRIELRENTKSQGELKVDVEVLKAQFTQFQQIMPKALSLLEAINDRFQSRLPKKLDAAPANEDPPKPPIKLEETKVAPGVMKLKKEKS